MRVLLVEPEYYTQYPPLGLLKLSTFHKNAGHEVRFIRGRRIILDYYPDEVDVSSLFTWAWKPVWDCVQFYKALFPKSKVRLGGIYASLMPNHAKLAGADEVMVGTDAGLDSVVPDYDLTPRWKSNILFTSRGCIRSCSFCAVPAIEPRKTARGTLRGLLDPRFHKVILWDNNFFGTPNWRGVIEEIRDMNLTVDFNQGIDGRLVFEETAATLEGVKIQPIRMAYDSFSKGNQRAMERAINLLGQAGFRKRKMVVYVLYNFTDSPEDFFYRVRDLLNWGVVTYPMRFEPLNSLEKNKHVASQYGWTEELLDMVAQARRVIGYGGAFPPYEGLQKKFNRAANFFEAFELRPERKQEEEIELAQELFDMGQDHQFPTHSLALA